MAGMASALQQGWLSLDVEYGNVHGFFSGARARSHGNGAAFCEGFRKFTGHLQDAAVDMEDCVVLEPDRLLRRLTFTMLNDSSVYDLVSRFVAVDRSFARNGSIHGQTVHHEGRSRYHQYPATSAVVPIGDAQWLSASFSVEGDLPPNMAHVAYIRDEACTNVGNRWILHHRLIALPKADNLALRGCNPRFDHAVPPLLNRLVPASIKHQLYRIRETRWPHAPVMAVAHAQWRAGQRVTLVTDLRLSHGERPQ